MYQTETGGYSKLVVVLIGVIIQSAEKVQVETETGVDGAESLLLVLRVVPLKWYYFDTFSEVEVVMVQ